MFESPSYLKTGNLLRLKYMNNKADVTFFLKNFISIVFTFILWQYKYNNQWLTHHKLIGNTGSSSKALVITVNFGCSTDCDKDNVYYS